MEGTDNSDLTAEQEETKEIPEHIKLLVNKPDELINYLSQRDKVESEISPVAWELISSIMECLKENAPENLSLFKECFTKIVEFSKPKEIILGLLEHFDPSTETKHVLLLFPALRFVCNRLLEEGPKTCAVLFETAYATFSYYLESLNLPNYDSFEPNEKSKNVFEAEKIEQMTREILDVIKPIIEKLCYEKESIDFVSYKQHTFRFLCNLLVILSQVDVDIKEEKSHPDDHEKLDKSAAENVISSKTVPENCNVFNICRQILDLFHLFDSPVRLFNSTKWFNCFPDEELSEEGKVEIEKQVERARACYMFLSLARGMQIQDIPQIYSCHHYFVNCVVSLDTLMSCKNQIVILKGVELFSYIMDRAPQYSLSLSRILHSLQQYYSNSQLGRFSENDVVKHTFLCLINVATTIPSEGIRKKAVKLISVFLDSLLWGDRYAIVLFLLETVKHTGVLGYLIGYLKNKLDQIIRNNPPNDCENFFDISKMLVLGELIFTLPCGTETDLLSDSDRIMPALNLLRFLLIRDKENRSGIKNHLDKIEKDFLKPLRTALDLSRAHYRAELKRFEKKRGKDKDLSAGEPDFTVNGMPLPNLPYREQKKTLESALHSFDMIEIVTVRVGELMEAIS